jgi:aspartate racemase
MPTHVGIVACSPPGAALCFELLSTGASALTNSGGGHIEVSMHSHPLSEYMRSIDAGDWDGVAQLMLSSAGKLANIGAQFLVAPCNTIHTAFDRVTAESPLPWLHIAAEVASEAHTRGYKRVGLLGTMFMMEGSVYPSQLQRYGIDSQIPEAAERKRLNRFIFDEMVHGEFSVEAREQALDLLQAMHRQECDAVGLCCTELPLLLRGIESPLPVLDSTTILAQAALKVLEGKKLLGTATLNRVPAHVR